MGNSYWLNKHKLPAHLKTVSSNFQLKFKIMIHGSFSAESGASSCAFAVQNASRSIIHVEARSSNHLSTQIAEFDGLLMAVQYVTSHHLQHVILVMDCVSLVKAMNDMDVELDRHIISFVDRLELVCRHRELVVYWTRPSCNI